MCLAHLAGAFNFFLPVLFGARCWLIQLRLGPMDAIVACLGIEGAEVDQCKSGKGRKSRRLLGGTKSKFGSTKRKHERPAGTLGYPSFSLSLQLGRLPSASYSAKPQLSLGCTCPSSWYPLHSCNPTLGGPVPPLPAVPSLFPPPRGSVSTWYKVAPHSTHHCLRSPT